LLPHPTPYTLLLAAWCPEPQRTARADHLIKRPRYQRAGIEFWIVDLDARLVERWRPGDERPEILADRLEWLPEADTDPLVLDLGELFREVEGE
jgi:hypothetical protein